MTTTATPLDTVAATINAHIAEAVVKAREALALAVRAGELLGEAKSHLTPSEWQRWVQANIHSKERTCEATAWQLLSLAGQAQESRIQRLASAIGIHQDDVLQDSDRRRPI